MEKTLNIKRQGIALAVRKTVSLFLSVVMLMSITAGIDFTAHAEVLSGNWGYYSDVYWELDTESGKLTITGSGEMDYYNNNAFDEETVKTVVILSDITSINSEAFSDYTSLTSVTIPKTVKSIGDRAFYNCSSLTKIVIPEGVTTIGTYAFANCKKLSSVTIPSTAVKFTDKYQFYSSAFSNCPLLKTAGPLSSNANIKFGWTDIIPAGVFSYCTSLTSITIPSSITKIGKYAFKGCKNLTKISIPKNVASIGEGAFNDCKALTDISVDKKNKKYSSADGNLFNKDKTQLIQYAIGKSSTKYTAPKSVTKVAYAAFAESSKLKDIKLSANLKSIGDYAFANDKKLTGIEIPEKVTTIGLRAFNYCTALKSIVIPDKVKAINPSTFAFCESLESVKIGNSVSKICNRAFEECTKLPSIKISDSVKEIEWWAFHNCKNLKKLDFGNGVEIIGSGIITGCDKLKTISLPDSVKTIQDSAFSGTKLENVEIKSGDIGEGAFAYCKNLKTLTLGNKVTRIQKLAFANCEKLKEVKIPDSCKTVGEQAFAGCKSLKSADVGATVTKIVYNLFEDCSSLSEVRVLNPKSKIDDNKNTIPKKATIYGYKNSTAQDYAKKYNRKFVALIDASNYSVTLSKTEFVYDGKNKKPQVVVKNAKGKKISADYYDVIYASDIKGVGKYKVTVVFKHQYVGTINKSFSIKPKATSISSVKSGKKSFTVKWKKQASQTSGYEIQYSTKKSFKGAKSITVKGKSTSVTVKGVKAKQKYFVRVRTYKTVDGKKIYSSWSKAETVTTK